MYSPVFHWVLHHDSVDRSLLALLTLYALLPGFFNHLPIWLQRDVKSGHKGPTIWLLRGVWAISEKHIKCRLVSRETNSCNKIPRRYQPYHFGWKPPVLANISGLSFSLNILPVFETLPSQRKIMFSSFNQSFLARFLAVFLWLLSHFYPFGIRAWACDNFRCSNNALLRLE